MLRKKYSELPIIAIEPAYKMVYDYSYDKPTLIMATKATIESKKFLNLYNKYNNNKTFLLACSGLADFIEKGDKEEIRKYLKINLSKYATKVQNVVLGCTHYPLIQDEIKEVLGDVEFFNGAESLAKHLKSILEEKHLINTSEIKGNIEFIDSSELESKKERFFHIMEKTC